jgi:hypothetical protein
MLAGWLFGRHGTAQSAAPPPPDPAIPVTAGTAQSQDVPGAVVSAEHARGSAD